MKTKIEHLDENLKLPLDISEKNLVFYDIRQAPFAIFGLYQPQTESCLKRLPDSLARSVSPSMAVLARHTAGGRVRFQTDSKYVAVRAVMPDLTHMSHMALSGSSGFDLYERGRGFYKAFIPPADMQGGYASMQYFPDRRCRDLTIHFPLYNEVTALYIGLESTASLLPPTPYTHPKPVVFYGSSITQGGCASRPGTSYPAILSRRYDFDFFNFGFSGNARGEEAVITYLAQLDYSVFVLDYDHNAPSADALAATHFRAYEILRRYQPSRPIVLVSKPDFSPDSTEDRKRRQIIRTTYRRAVQMGDHHIFYINGASLFAGQDRDGCTVDGCHPNDLGFYRMANGIGRILGPLLSAES